MEQLSAPAEFPESPGLTNLRQTQLRGPWLIMGLLLVIAVLAGAAYGVNQVVTNSDICVTCHEMRPEFYTWQASSHSQIKCTDCHLPVDPWQRVVRNFEGLRQVVEHYTGTYPKVIQIRQPVPKEVCLKCHTLNRQATIPGDLIISHKDHDAHGVECVGCHSGVVHGRIVERGKIKQTSAPNWTAQMGRQEAQLSVTAPKMIQCLQCHRKWKVSTQCEKCHKKIPTPPSHQPGTWLTLHGQEAWKDVNQCSRCHWDQRLLDSNNKLSVAQYIRQNSFCFNCHTKYRPPSHIDSWAHDHASHVDKGEVPYCITCHDIDKPKSPNGIGVYCNQCHGKFYIDGQKIEGF